MNLIEKARLTPEELRAIYDSNIGSRGRCSYRDFSEAQLAKALWAVVDWIFENHTALAAMKIISELEAAGLKRPGGGSDDA